MGTENGEETLLSPEEKIDIFKVVSNTLKNKMILIAGVDNPSISGTLNESEKYAELGADLIRIRIPRRRNTIDKYFKEVLKEYDGLFKAIIFAILEVDIKDYIVNTDNLQRSNYKIFKNVFN